IKWFELIDLFTDPRKFDWTPGYLPHGKRSTAPGVTVEFRENQPRQLERILEMRCYADRLLAGRRIANKKDFLRMQQIGKSSQFPDQRLVYLKTTGSIKNLNISILRFCPLQC